MPPSCSCTSISTLVNKSPFQSGLSYLQTHHETQPTHGRNARPQRKINPAPMHVIMEHIKPRGGEGAACMLIWWISLQFLAHVVIFLIVSFPGWRVSRAIWLLPPTDTPLDTQLCPSNYSKWKLEVFKRFVTSCTFGGSLFCLRVLWSIGLEV